MTHARSIEVYSSIQFRPYGLLKFVFLTNEFACMGGSHITPKILLQLLTYYTKPLVLQLYIPVMTVPDGGVGSGDTCAGDDTRK